MVLIFGTEDLAFQARMLKQSGTGERTAWPPGIVRCLEGVPQNLTIASSRKEAEVRHSLSYD